MVIVRSKMKAIFMVIFSAFWLGMAAQADNSGFPSTLPLRTGDLKNGYQLIIVSDENYRSLRLLGPGIDTLLQQITTKQDRNELGFLLADVDSFFILQYPNDNMKIYAKHTGQVITQGTFIEKDASKDIVFFVDAKKPGLLSLYDLKKKRIESYESPYDSNSSSPMRIGNKQIGDNYLVVWYILPDNTLKKKYYARP